MGEAFLVQKMRESSFLIFGCFQVAAAYHTVEIRDDVVNINLDTNAILNKIGLEHPFVCANFDWWPDEKCDYGNCSWVGNGINKLDFDNEVLQAAATALSTSSTGYGANFGLLRIGGSLQDHINYDFTTMDEHCAPFPMKLDPNDHLGFDQGCVTIWKRDQIRKLAKDTGLQVVFGLNALKGRTKYEPYWNYTGDWDYTEAKKLLDEWPELFAVELGNEIAGHHGVTAHLDPKQYAKDFAVLLQLRNNLNIKRKPFVFGVDNALDLKWMDEFLGNLTRFSNSTIDTFTWHSYPLGAGALSKVDEEIMDPSFAQKIIHTGEEIRQWSKDKPFPVWMGETGGAYNSGRNTVTNRFMSAFWYLDWMGILSAAGHKSFCRQTLVGGNYGLLQNINGKMVPNPDFWGAKLFNDLLRGEVINGWFFFSQSK